MHHLVALPHRDPAGVADQARGADAALGGAEVRAVEEARGAATQQMVFGAVVAGEDHDRVVRDTQFGQGVQDRTEVVVEHQQRVAPVAVDARTLELLAHTIGKCISE